MIPEKVKTRCAKMNEERDFLTESLNRQVDANSPEERSAVHDGLVFEEDLVCMGIDAQTPEEVLRILSDRLVEKGCVTDGFFKAVVGREKKFPTGLPTPIPVALAHTDAVYCKRSAISVGILRTPVSFGEMGNPDSYLPVEIVFLLALADPGLETQWLQHLIRAFRENDFLQKLRNMQTKQEVAEFVNQVLKDT